MIGRRDFLALLGGAAWPIAAQAQQAGRLPTIGYLGTTTPSIQTASLAAFVQRLRTLGWVEGSLGGRAQRALRRNLG
jgi:putative ABC transport system substrate-binding protein